MNEAVLVEKRKIEGEKEKKIKNLCSDRIARRTTHGLQPHRPGALRSSRARSSRTWSLELGGLVDFKDVPPVAAEGLLLRQLPEARRLEIRCEAAAAADVLVVAQKHDATGDHGLVHRSQNVLDLLGRVDPPPAQQPLYAPKSHASLKVLVLKVDH